MATTAVPLPVQLNKEMKFAARRVPDFAKLHALEDARLARWKKEHKKEVTVPLNFRLAAPVSAHAPQTYQTKPTTPSHGSSNGPSSSRGTSKSAGAQSNPGRSLASSYANSVVSENTGFTESSGINKVSTKPRESAVPALQLRSDHFKENEISNPYNNTLGLYFEISILCTAFSERFKCDFKYRKCSDAKPRDTRHAQVNI